MLEAIIAILCGLILGARLIPALGGASRTLAPFGGILGVVAIVLGVLGLLGGFGWLALVLLLAGLILGAQVIPQLSGMAATLNPVGGVIGLVAIVLGVLAIL